MKKKSLLILLVVMCIGFVPKNTFALEVYNNVNIDYQFFVDEDESNAGNLNFKLYDKSGDLSFNSKYDSATKHYYFEYDENGFYKESYYSNYYNYYIYWWNAYDWGSYEANFREYVPYVDELYKSSENWDYSIPSKTEFLDFLSLYHLNGSYNDFGMFSYTFYSYVPLILENVDTGIKKICFASINVRQSWSVEFVHFFFVNNTTKWREENTTLGSSFLENVNFMRKTMLDYSDELWEELNNGPIASTEISNNNKASVNYNYVNQSIGTGEQNVPEETLDDFASSLPVFSFKKQEIAKEESNNIVDVITNPKTWNSGVIILVISMIIIIGSSFILIKRKNN